MIFNILAMKEAHHDYHTSDRALVEITSEYALW